MLERKFKEIWGTMQVCLHRGEHRRQENSQQCSVSKESGQIQGMK